MGKFQMAYIHAIGRKREETKLFGKISKNFPN
jgi:hypothetical protein